MSTCHLGKEGGRATEVRNDPGGAGRTLTRGPDTEATLLGDGGWRSMGNPDEHSSSDIVRVDGG
eukprot:12792967-Alexandrium_andersonii.AAC.1